MLTHRGVNDPPGFFDGQREFPIFGSGFCDVVRYCRVSETLEPQDKLYLMSRPVRCSLGHIRCHPCTDSFLGVRFLSPTPLRIIAQGLTDLTWLDSQPKVSQMREAVVLRCIRPVREHCLGYRPFGPKSCNVFGVCRS